MGKKRLRKKKTSKGLHTSTNMSFTLSTLDKMANKVVAWQKGLKVMLTVPNPDKSITNKSFIRVTADSYWGPYKRAVSK
jgi:hypothetical protein